MTVDGRDTSGYWERRARPHLGTAREWQAVSGTGLPPWVGRCVQRLEERGVRALARHLPGGRVLDVGCGYGRWLPLTGPGRGVIGMDFSPSLAARASRRPHGLAVLVADARRIPLRAGSVDAVYTVKVLQCLPQRQRAAAVAELFRAVRPGGVVALLEKTSGEDGSPPQQWRRWAEQAGGTLARWSGNHYAPLDRLLAALARRAPAAPPDSGPAAPGPAPARRERSPRLFGAYTAVRGALLGLCLPLEPALERACPPGWAQHGLFVFRKA